MKCLWLLAFLILTLIAATSARAADLQVSIFELEAGTGNLRPVVGARVCVGSQNNPTQVGSQVMNNPEGYITFNNVPTGEWTVTVSAQGYQGQRRTISITGSNAAATFSLDRCTGGDCGPVCDNPLGITQPGRRTEPGTIIPLAVNVTDFYINRKEYDPNNPSQRRPGLTQSRDVRLYFNYSGLRPTQYRASESEDFSGAVWQNLPAQEQTGDPSVNFTLAQGGSTLRTVYFQLRAGSSLNIANVQSDVASDRVETNFRTHKFFFLAGSDKYYELLRYAKEQGYSFEATRLSSEGGSCTINEFFDLFLSPYISGIQRWASPLTCSFDLFKGRRLNPGWKMVYARESFTLDNLPWCSRSAIWTKPVSGDEDPHMTLMGTLGGGAGCNQFRIYIQEFQLEGPEGADWRAAFRRPPLPIN